MRKIVYLPLLLSSSSFAAVELPAKFDRKERFTMNI
jgi:hypothetical protein